MEIIEAIESGANYKGKGKLQMQVGVTALPHFPKDTTDRNRTSPFAFTGNKFEFRMVGSTFSIAGPNIVLNTIVAESLRQFADTLEKSKDFNKEVQALVKTTVKEHKRIVFNGNNYAEEWVTEASKRGLSNLRTTVEALPAFIAKKSVDLFTKHRVFTKGEIHSRYDILLEAYCKTLHIEALTTVDLVKGKIIPASIEYQGELAELLERKKACGDFDTALEGHLLSEIAKLSSCLLKRLTALENAISGTKDKREILAQAKYYRDSVFAAMSELRLIVDELETLTSKKVWPLPTYAEMLFSVI